MTGNAKKIADCRELYEKYGGRCHEQIEREMRALGHAKFRRRILYPRNERGRRVPGWIERFGWKSVPPAVAGGLSRRKYNHSKLRRLKKLRKRRRNFLGSEKEVFRRSSGQAAKVHPSSFEEWLRRVSPSMNWDWRHLRPVYEALQRVTDGTCRRLMIFMPPRHGKSELVTVRYAAWRLKQNPAMNVIIGSHTQRLAGRFSRKIKRVLCDDHALSEPAASACTS